MPDDQNSGTAPSRIGRYQVLREIGRGAMGRVYLAHDPNIGRRLALKLLLPSIPVARGTESELQKRFVLEARAAGRLNHPGIVGVYDAGVDAESGLAFIAMEYVDGASLEDLLRTHGALGVEAAAEIAAETARALGYAHDQGVVHRDVKPANILIGRDGRLKVVDFGIAKLTAETHTVVGQVLGTPAYMSPEQVQGEPVDGRSDLFSLGAVLYQCVAGEGPFPGDTVAAITHKIINVDPRPPRGSAAEMPAGYWEVITLALEKPPEGRFESGRAFAKALRPFLPPAEDSRPTLAELVPPEPTPAPEAVPGPVASAVTAEAAESGRFDLGQVGRLWRLHRRWVVPAAAVGVLLAIVVPRSLGPPSSPHAALRSGEGEAASTVDQTIDGEATGDEAPTGDVESGRVERAESGAALTPQTTLVVLHENRLKSATMTIWLDGKEQWSSRISAGGNFFQRARGKLVRATIPVPPGDHEIEVRVTGARRKVDAVDRTTGFFSEGETRYLRARLIPVVDDLELDWGG